jgi:hypothetical protein
VKTLHKGITKFLELGILGRQLGLLLLGELNGVDDLGFGVGRHD